MAFDGKMVRMKAVTAVAGFDEFVIDGAGCSPAGAIWLSYPVGAKGKAGPVAIVRLQLAKNAAAVPSASERSSVTLQRNDDFARFDSLLATPYKSRATCLGCPRYTVTATVVGRIDAVSTHGLIRDDSGKVTGLAGFGNLSLYRARLVLQTVSDVTPHDVDYSAGATPARGDSRRAQRATADQLTRAIAAFGAEGEDNGVIVGFGMENEVPSDEMARGSSDSPDGILFNVKFDMNRLSKEALSAAMAHAGTHIADIRSGAAAQGVSAFEDRAWQATFH
jgi:hypothetical protein